ncbi:MAG: TlyA family RNA methyltransferase [Anaerolineales bacterium]|nr:TlyA family RNA methyltransferase [Anaerolineales bacterium]
MPKPRLDQRLHELGLTPSREQARKLIMAGEVLVNGQLVDKPATAVALEAEITLKAKPRFVSRGGEKLDAALEQFGVAVAGLVCADVGASTGGFTDCLLQRGAAKVYAIDVGHGVLDYKLRTDPRVVVMEETNARHAERLPEPIHFVSVDVSFISLKLILPVIKHWFAPLSNNYLPTAVCLIKPQFEAGRKEVSKGGGVIRDGAVHRRVLEDVLNFAVADGWAVRGLVRSPLVGPKGNAEFLAWLEPGGAAGDVLALVEAVTPTVAP